MTAVWEASNARGTQRLVLLAIADCANDEGVAWPAMPKVARKCGLTSERGVRMHVMALEEMGELEVIERRGRSNLFRVRLETLRAENADKPPQNPSPPQKRAGVQNPSAPPRRILPPSPAESCGGPPQNPADEPKGNPKGNGEGTDVHETPPPPSGFVEDRGTLPWLEAKLGWIYPDEPGTLPQRERVAVLREQGVLAELTDDDWLGLRVWLVEADDQVRKRKRWPRSRAEFLDHCGEAVGKVRKWWRWRGARWWAAKGNRVAAKDAGPTEDFLEFWQAEGDGRPVEQAWADEAVAHAYGRWITKEWKEGAA